MRRGNDYEWTHITTLPTKNFACGQCAALVSSNEGFHGAIIDKFGNTHPQYIYICHSCSEPNFFDINDNQSPILYKLKQEFPDHIKKLSQEFVETYNQSLSAEKLGLTKIAGPGYRRSLEFLVKDFLINQTSDEAVIQGIKDKQLGPAIGDLANEKIKSTARGATYIGNDETHYIRKWSDKDMQDLKKFIGLTVYWMEAELATDEMQEEMGV